MSAVENLNAEGMSDADIKRQAEKERQEEELKKRQDEALKKFHLTAENKSALKQGLLDIIDRQFETFNDSYIDIFRTLPIEILEGMTQGDAVRFMNIVVQEAMNNLMHANNAMKNEILKSSFSEKTGDIIADALVKGMGEGTFIVKGLDEKNPEGPPADGGSDGDEGALE